MRRSKGALYVVDQESHGHLAHMSVLAGVLVFRLGHQWINSPLPRLVLKIDRGTFLGRCYEAMPGAVLLPDRATSPELMTTSLP